MQITKFMSDIINLCCPVLLFMFTIGLLIYIIIANKSASLITLLNDTLSNNTLFNNTLTNNTLFNNTLTNNTLFNNTLTNNTLFNSTLTNNTLFNSTLTNNTLFNSTLSLLANSKQIENNEQTTQYISLNYLFLLLLLPFSTFIYYSRKWNKQEKKERSLRNLPPACIKTNSSQNVTINPLYGHTNALKQPPRIKTDFRSSNKPVQKSTPRRRKIKHEFKGESPKNSPRIIKKVTEDAILSDSQMQLINRIAVMAVALDTASKYEEAIVKYKEAISGLNVLKIKYKNHVFLQTTIKQYEERVELLESYNKPTKSSYNGDSASESDGDGDGDGD